MIRTLSRLLPGLLAAAGLTACIGAGPVSEVAPGAEGRVPAVVGTNLFGDEIAIPAAFAGRRNLIAMGYVREHQDDIDTWIAVADALAPQYPDFRFYEVPVIYEGSALFRWWLNNGMRMGIPDPKARERTITVYLDRDRFNAALDIEDMTDIRLVLLDGDGRILWRMTGPVAAGPAGEAQIASLEALLR